MREISVKEITKRIAMMVQNINYAYPSDIEAMLKASAKTETSKIGKETLTLLLENARIAKEDHIPICQDTGMVIVFAKIGQEVVLVDGDIKEAINEGVALGYEEGYLRKSIVSDPLFERKNTKNNTPCIIYFEIVSGDQVVLEVGCKGFGSENMSVITMLKPAQGVEGVKEVVLSAIKKAGPNACPPMVVGVGIGGTFDYASMLAKKATLRDCSLPNPDEKYAKLEEDLLAQANALNIGPQGLKGDTTVFKINIEHFPTHIAGLPCAVNISCHVTRHAKEVI
ncbi:MAG: fumarate hydratase [Erysipelotrichia bacterium]|nr:fumarate hydratase [Erysipelotrichia bacterium]